ncbi:DUF1223 domain-containing protein [Roseovarius sp. D22-M7]|uniref:DUF1223 domain-containing protein n=1 Tax=Roseovarius sp. D22-M7 TaxID=3127116 RepID=UPI0030102944
MRQIFLGALAALFLAPAAEADAPVVVELFTAQGCPACPPADAFLADLAARDDVIALSLHVDYWDYMGWEDTFGSPENSARQRGYARAQGHKMVYTPQMIVGGADYAVGTHRADIIDLIDAHLDRGPGDVTLEITRAGDHLSLRAVAQRPRDRPLLVQRVEVIPEAEVRITRGENAGRAARHVNVVTGIARLATWDMQAPLELEIAAPGQGASVILLQEGRHGPIAAAARVGP